MINAQILSVQFDEFQQIEYTHISTTPVKIQNISITP